MILITFLLISISFPACIYTQKSPNIAIIGGGIGGTSCAYFLKELFHKLPVTVFEKDAIGGRMRVMNVDGHQYEAGGTVIHPLNQHMVQFSKILGLGMHKPQLHNKLGIYDGQKFVFEESDWYLITILKMIWQYQLSVFYLFRDIKSMLDDFSRIYSMQDKGYAFTSVEHLLDAMSSSFKNMSQSSILNILLKRGYSEIFLNELVQSVMMVNYGQTNNISGFAGFVSLAGADSNLWSTDGGNHLIPEGLLEISGAKLVKANVLEVVLLPNETFSVKYQKSPSEDQILSENFDIIVLSAPLIKGNNNIRFVNFRQNFQQFERPYHQTVTTFVKGTLKSSSFHRNSIPDEILTNNNNLLFNSISKVLPVDTSKNVTWKNVYKVFSEKPLSRAEIETLFQDVSVIEEKVWQAYPHYYPPEKFVPFVLYPGIYYTNAIELSASAMEMSSISAKNIALLIYNSWHRNNKIDRKNVDIKDEL